MVRGASGGRDREGNLFETGDRERLRLVARVLSSTGVCWSVESIDIAATVFRQPRQGRLSPQAHDPLSAGRPSCGGPVGYRLVPALTGYLYHCNVPPGDREDILQECWIRVHRSRHKYRDTEPVLPWVFAIMRHTRLDAYRKMRRRRSREIEMPILPERGVAIDALGDLEARKLLDHLPEAHRQILWMMKVEGRNVPEVAAALRCSEGAVKQRAHRAYTKLRSLLRALE